MQGPNVFFGPCQMPSLTAAFRFLPVLPQTAGDLVKLPIDVLNFVVATRQVVPSSPVLAVAMTDPLPLEHSEIVVEFGAGTGAITYELLNRMPRDAKLFAFEINNSLAWQLRRNIVDRRLLVFEKSVEFCGEVLRQHDVRRVDAVASSVGLTIMPTGTRKAAFESIIPFLGNDSVVTQFQYLNAMRISRSGVIPFDANLFLKRCFPQVTCQVVLLNLPPVKVFVCRRSTGNA